MTMANERGELVWEPPADAWQRSRLAEFAGRVGERGGPTCDDFAGLLEWSLGAPGAFWAAVADWGDVRWHDRPSQALESPAMPGAVWFPGGTLNYAERALAQANLTPHASAVIARSQTRDRTELTWTDLHDQVARCRAGLRALGVARGDRVAAFTPNIAETLVAFLATASLGAIWSSCAPEFGVRAVTDRWVQIEPKVLIAVDGYRYGERRIERSGHVREIVDALPSLEHVVHLAYLDPGTGTTTATTIDDTTTIDGTDGTIGTDRTVGSIPWERLLAAFEPLEFEPVPFDHPLYVLYSSGTTGLPKPIVHGHGGITLEHLKALGLHSDLRPGERFTWFTTTGWMMWNFVVSGLLVGATVVLFDGDPAAPDLLTLWRLAEEERVDVFGVSAPFLMACRKAGLAPGSTLDLGHVRHVGSTGAPLPAEGFRWVREAVGEHVQTGSMSGGTDVCTAFVGAAPTLPVRAGEISTRMLACDVRAVDGRGDRCPPGVTGELVIGTPMPSMPVGLWGDESGERFRSTYFETYPGMWHHGDWIVFHADGACEITGRSDATLNRGGVRLGTSDFYVVVESFAEVVDSLVVHLEADDGGPGELILLVVCAPGVTLDDDLRGRIGRELRNELSPRHVPDVIDQIAIVPRTLSGKKLEVPVKRMLLGAAVGDVAARDSLSDPSALDAIAGWVARRAAR